MEKKAEVKEERLQPVKLTVQDIRLAVQKMRESGKPPEVLICEGEMFELVRRDPWFGDNGKEKRFAGLPVEEGKTNGKGFVLK